MKLLRLVCWIVGHKWALARYGWACGEVRSCMRCSHPGYEWDIGDAP